MKKTKLVALFTLVFVLSITLISPVLGQKKSTKKPAAGGNALGAKIFVKECTACHDKGENVVESDKTLKLDVLKKFGFNGPEDIKVRVQKGKGVMPVYEDLLKPNEIEAVSKYVWDRAQKNWK